MATSVTLKPNAIDISGSTSGTTTLQASAVAGTTTLTLPAATDTLVGKATTDTLTNKTLTGAAMNGTLGATTPSTASVTTLTTSSTVTHSGGTANGVAYLDGSKVLTTGSALVFDGSNLGVGTSSPAVKFQIYGGAGVNTYSRIDTAAGQEAGLQFADGGTLKWTIYKQSGNALEWYNHAASSVAMTLDASGNLGIGVTSPTAKLDVVGASGVGIYQRINNTTAGAEVGLQFADAGTLKWTMYKTAGNALGWFNHAGATTAMTLDSSGNLLVGTTSAFSGAKLSVNGSNADFIAAMENTSGTTPAGLRIKYTGVSGGSGGAFLYLHDTNALRCQVAGNGNVTNANNSYGSTSDAKLKENIVDATPKLSSMMQVRVVNYNLIGDQQKQLGVVAQELEQIFPGMIDESPDKDAEGNDLGTTTKAVKYSVFVPMLIKAIQEQQAIIQSLTARITALESA